MGAISANNAACHNVKVAVDQLEQLNPKRQLKSRRKTTLIQMQKCIRSRYSSICLGIVYGLFMFLFVSYLILDSPYTEKEEQQEDNQVNHDDGGDASWLSSSNETEKPLQLPTMMPTNLSNQTRYYNNNQTNKIRLQ